MTKDISSFGSFFSFFLVSSSKFSKVASISLVVLFEQALSKTLPFYTGITAYKWVFIS